MKKITCVWAVAAALTLSGLTAQAQEKNGGIKKENRDESVKPGNDFYQYANGTWMKNNPLTPEYSRYGSFEVLEQKTSLQLRELIDELSKTQHEKGTVAQKVADIYNLTMNTEMRNKLGYEPIQADQQKIASIANVDQLFNQIAEMMITGVSPFFGCRIGSDRMDSNKKLVAISQGGTGLGQKDYYTEDAAATVKVREAYKALMVDLFKLTGSTAAQAQQKMENAWRIENRLANAQLDRNEMRDPTKTYHKIAYSELKERYNKLNWDSFFQILGINPKEVNVSVFAFMDEVQTILTTENMDALKNYVEWNLVRGAANNLSEEIEARSFEFNGKVLQGTTEQVPLWKRSLNSVNRTMGMALGQMYAEKYFPAENKERMLLLVKNLLTAMGKRVDKQEWMSAETKQKAHEKIAKFSVKIGYPDKWKDYSDLDIDPSKSLYENMKAVSVWNYWERAKKFDEPVDKTEMGMTPQTVNASYSSTSNGITFPAGILQYPFFDMSADDAFNYGAIGVVIGHEITHGFDDNGARYDGDGNFTNWWTPEDEAQFKAKGDQLAAWFDKIVVLKGQNGEPDLHANGRNTLGENLSDHGGLEMAWEAYKEATKGQEEKVIDGLTPAQRFFLAYATIWGQNVRDAEIIRRTKTDSHSLGRWRVNGTLPHINAWYEAFNIQPGDAMYVAPENRISVW
ncbi:MAG: M13 family metallopeptidase [Bacteroidaceae bacterium]|nr:M13 family metallopeptidase [Bacteroidaceae bacterium]